LKKRTKKPLHIGVRASRHARVNLPKEVRVVLFEPQEVVVAARGFLSRQMRRGDAVHVDRVTLTQGPDGILCELHAQSGARRVMQHQDLLMAMLLFCSGHRIPLPARADKSLKLSGAVLMLEMTMPLRSRLAP
jgi:hypothetical protein